MIRARAYPDDHAAVVHFDATRWFEQADMQAIVELAECGWGGDVAADMVALESSDWEEKLREMFNYVHATRDFKKADFGFECHVDEDDARKWLEANGLSSILSEKTHGRL